MKTTAEAIILLPFIIIGFIFTYAFLGLRWGKDMAEYVFKIN